MPEGTPHSGLTTSKPPMTARIERPLSPHLDLSLDPDDGAVHRPPPDRCRAVFRHLAAGVVADRGGIGARRLCQRAGLYLELHRPADRLRLYLGAAASSAQRHQAFRLGPRLRLQAERT